jgi:hypothetical protein
MHVAKARICSAWKYACKAAVIIWILSTGTPARAQAQVVTHRYDNQRTGANLAETVLTPANVNASQFGLLFTRSVDDLIYAQPLYLPGVAIPGQGTHNVVYVATMNNSIYAFDADDPAQPAPLWQTSLGTPVNVSATFGKTYPEIAGGAGSIGALATPVIDPVSNTLYACCSTSDAPTGPYHTLLYALDVTTGQSHPGSPVEITASIPSTGAGASHGVLKFDSSQHMVRPALLLDHGVVYIAAGSHGDFGSVYHGWVFAYDAATLTQRGVFCVTQHSFGGSVWQAGAGPAADAAGNVYVMTANGSNQPQVGDDGDSFIKLQITSAGLVLVDYFTPYNAQVLSKNDMDLGSSGPMLLPGTQYLVGAGKECKLYVLDTSEMGEVDYDSTGKIIDIDDDSRAVQWFEATTQPWVSGQTGVPSHHIHGSPATFTNANGQQFIYVWPENEYLQSFAFTGSQFITTPFAESAFKASTGMPGGFLSVSANGAQNGLLWASRPLSDANTHLVNGCLEAFDPTTLQLLYDSQTAWNRDSPGLFAKFVPPVVANGKVYLATFSKQLAVYGLLAIPSPVMTVSGIQATEIDLSWSDPTATVTGYSIERSTDGVHFTALASGLAPSTSQYADTTVAQGTTYYYRMNANTAQGLSPYSNELILVTPTPPPTAPVLSAPKVTVNSISLAWTVTGAKATFLQQSPDGTNFSTLVVLSTATSFTISRLASNTTYYYRAYATNAGGKSPMSNVLTVTTLNTPPKAPTGLTATVISHRTYAFDGV